MSRRLKLVLGLVALQGVAMLAVLGISYWASQDMLLRFSEDLAARISRDTTAYAEGYLDPAKETVAVTHRLIERQILDADSPSQLKRYFLELLAEKGSLDGIYMGLQDGSFLYASRASGKRDPGAIRLKRVVTEPERQVSYEWYSEGLRRLSTEEVTGDDYDPRTRPWYIAARAEDATIWTKPYIFFTSQEPGITAAAPVHNTLGTAIVGAVGVDIKITALSGFLEALDISPRGRAAIVSEDLDIIAHSRAELLQDGEFKQIGADSDPILAEAAAGVDGGLGALLPGEIRLTRFEVDGEVWLGSVLRLELERTPWTVVTYLPESDILAPLQAVRNTAWIAWVLALIATAVLGYAYGQRVMG